MLRLLGRACAALILTLGVADATSAATLMRLTITGSARVQDDAGDFFSPHFNGTAPIKAVFLARLDEPSADYQKDHPADADYYDKEKLSGGQPRAVTGYVELNGMRDEILAGDSYISVFTFTPYNESLQAYAEKMVSEPALYTRKFLYFTLDGYETSLVPGGDLRHISAVLNPNNYPIPGGGYFFTELDYDWQQFPCDYHEDCTFSHNAGFTSLNAVAHVEYLAVPDAKTWTMMLAGFFELGVILRLARRRRRSVVAC